VVGGQHRPSLFFFKSSEALQQTLRQVIDAAGKTLGEQGRCQCFGSHHRLPRHPRLGCQEPLYNFTSPCVVARRRALSTDKESETDGYISTHTCTIQYKYSTRRRRRPMSHQTTDHFRGAPKKNPHFFLRLQDVPVTHIVEQTGW